MITILDFTVEEINLIDAYIAEDKSKAIARIVNHYALMDKDMKEIAKNAVRKLSAMTDEEYGHTLFIPAE